MNKISVLIPRLLFPLLVGFSAAASAGPIIIAGTDADDHGSSTATTNITGWLFMQKAFENVGASVTNGNQTITCIGCNGSQAGAAYTSATAKSLLASTWSFRNLTSQTDITGFFDGTGTANAGNTGILYLPTVANNVGGGITDTQLSVVNSNAAALNNFVIGGGGLFTQEEANSTIGYGWLSTLLPSLTVQGDNGGPPFNSGALALTGAGNSAFPGLTDADLSNATPWHAWFSGNFGGLGTLATGDVFGAASTFPAAVVIGGGAGTIFQCGQNGQVQCAVPEPETLPLLGLGMIGLLLSARRKVKPQI